MQMRLRIAGWTLAAAVGLAIGHNVELAGSRLQTTAIRGSEYVSLTDVLRAFRGKCWRVNDRFVVLLPGDSAQPGLELVFRPESTVAMLADRRADMVLPPVVKDSELYLPAVALIDLLPGAQPAHLDSLEASRRGDTLVVFIAARRPGQRDASSRHSAATSTGRAAVKSVAPARSDTLVCHGEARSSLEYLLAVAARCDSTLVQQVKLLPMTGANLLKSVSVDSSSGSSFHLAFLQPTAVLLLPRTDGVELRLWPRPPRKVTRIVLDPGHGGKDPGAVSPGGTEEKRIVIDVARRLKKKLEAQGFEVLLTRDSDQYVPLSERSKCGNGSKADLFISIHANWTANRSICGFETYFLSEAKTDWERAVAARENASFEGNNGVPAPGMTDDVGLILADLAQNEFLWESSDLAAKIQEAAVPCARIRDRGVRQANFYVLRNNFMPAVLVECGFVSNRSEEKLLRSQNHRERLAEGICRGIVTYARQYEQKTNGHATQNPGAKR